MNNAIIAGVNITINFCKKVNGEPIDNLYRSKEPSVSIYKSENEGAFTVNIMAFLPTKLKELPEETLNSGLILEDTHKKPSLFLSYNGVVEVGTSVDKGGDLLLCREFNVEYDSTEKMVEQYHLYHIQFEYKLASVKFQSVEAIIVKLVNEDPETDRGTVSTVRDSD